MAPSSSQHPRSRAAAVIAVFAGVCLFVTGLLLEIRGDRTVGAVVRAASGIVVAAALLLLNPRSALYRVLALLIVGSVVAQVVIRVL